jgi:hypothetical protein
MLIYLSKKNQKVIDYQDNTPTHIILKTDDLITEKEKEKEPKKFRNGFILIRQK